MNYITEDDMVFTNDDEKGIYSGGFKVDSIMMKLGISPIMTVNKKLEKETDGPETKVSDLFSQLVVPNWIAYYPNKKGGEKDSNEKNIHLDTDDIETVSDEDDISIEENEDSIIGGSLYDRLVDLATVNEKELKRSKKNKTKRNKVKSSHKKTSKNK